MSDGTGLRGMVLGSVSALCVAALYVSGVLGGTASAVPPDSLPTIEIALDSTPEDSQPPEDYQALADTAFIAYVLAEYGSEPVNPPPYCVLDAELLASCQAQTGAEVVVAMSPHTDYFPVGYVDWMNSEELELANQAAASLADRFVSESSGLQQRQHRRALGGEHVESVLRAVLDGHEHLEHELVARRRSSTGTASHQAPSSSRPAAVISQDFWPSCSAVVTSPSRSSRSSVVYTCPTLSGHTPQSRPRTRS